MPVTSAAHQHYLRAIASGYAEQVSFSTLAAVEEAAGVIVPPRVPRAATDPESGDDT